MDNERAPETRFLKFHSVPRGAIGTNTAVAVVVRMFVLASCLLATASCDDTGETGPSVPLNERFVLAPGSVAVVAGADIGVQFVGVTGDSRCPADVVCIQGGDAAVQIRVFDAGTSTSYELHTGDARRASVAHRGLRIELLELQPYPFSSRTIDPADYRATIVVSG